MAKKLDLWADLAELGRLKLMFCAVEDEDTAIHGKSRNNVWVLRLITCLVDLTRMLNLVDNVTLDGRHLARLAIPTDLAAILVVIVRVWRGCFGDLYIGDLKIIGTVVRGVRSQQQAVNSVVLALWFLDIRKPLDR